MTYIIVIGYLQGGAAKTRAKPLAGPHSHVESAMCIV